MDEPLVLTTLMSSDRPDRTPVAFGDERLYTWNDFRSHVAGLCQELRSQPKGRWLLSCHSSYAFGVSLFALWQTGRIAVLPPNQQRESMLEAAMASKGLITDTSIRLSLPILTPLAVSLKKHSWKKLEKSQIALELYTSGSTGRRKAVKKTFAQLQSEIAILEKTFGPRMRDCSVYSTVSPQHIYGLLFRLLWPLSSGRPFSDETLFFWEELVPRLLKTPAACLVTSPTHLERITPAAKNMVRQAYPSLIFSSGGPLKESAVNFLRKQCGQTPVEVFGSTETGGVGWRQRDGKPKSSDWTPLSGVRISIANGRDSGAFIIRSSFVGSPQGTFLMSDCGQVLKDGSFRLLGRTDRIVKVAEKRLSLDDMERRLNLHPWTEKAKVVLLQEQNGNSRSILGAVIVLNSFGKRTLRRRGRADLSLLYKTHLQKSFDGSTLPRTFRFIDALPVNAEGKVPHTSLVSLFQAPPETAVTLPRLIRHVRGRSKMDLRYQVPHDLLYLKGHFPKHPLVPGVVQLHWVIKAAEEWLDRRITVRRMEAIKFKSLLLPGHTFSMRVEHDRSGPAEVLRFSLIGNRTLLYSSGRLVLA